MAILDFEGTVLPAEIISTTNGTWSLSGGSLVLSGADGNGNSEAVISGGLSGSYSIPLRTSVSEVTGNIGVNLRRTAPDDWVAALYSFQNKTLRILQKENGGATQTLASEVQAGGDGTAVVMNISVSTGNLISVDIDGGTAISATTSYNSTVDTFSIRLDNVAMEVESLTYPDPATGGLSKTITFDIPANIQGLPSMSYWVLPAAGGASLSDGTLDTSASTVTIDLTAVDSVTNGQKLYLWGTDENTATTGYSTWDDALAVVTGA